MVCKIEGCDCQRQEIPIHLLYWLSHHGIDIRPLFQKPYLNKKKKQVSQNDNLAVTDATYNFVPVENVGENVLEEFLFNIPNMEQETNVQPQTATSNVRRSVPYKVPATATTAARRRV